MFARTPGNLSVKIIEQIYTNDTYLSSPSDRLPEQTTFGEFCRDIIYKCHAYFTARLWLIHGLEAYRYHQCIPPVATT